jgi:UDPglucose 6-dehydrogenase
LSETPYIETTLESAEMIKYSSNAFLAVKISFINEIAALCEKIKGGGADVEEVALGMGLDKRIGRDFLKAGPGYGGSCFPKDTMAIASMARNHGERLSIVEATIEANKKQRHRMLEKIENGLGGKGAIGGKTFAVMGLAFKNNTNDIRESPAIEICEKLLEKGAVLRVWDPAAQKEAVSRLVKFADSVYFAKNEYDIFEKADAFVLLTEWNQAGNLDLEKIHKLMKSPVFFDLRNMYKRAEAEDAGFRYFSVGR